jgi:hypothetical protein
MAAEQASAGPSPALQTISRIGAAVLGGYAFVWGFTSLTIACALAMDFPFGESQTLAYLLAFLVYLAALLWAFAVRSASHAWLVLAGGGGVMTALAWLMTRG